ncbi:MAG: hypothetical protein ACU83U_00245 [Gammaproteobacteria bacterium]|nr:hypothetical protein [Methylobacter sp.]
MNYKIIIALLVLSFFSGTTMALNDSEWIYKEKQESLKSTPGCQSKEAAIEKAQSPYRVKKYAQLICQYEGYGWTLSEVTDHGTTLCDECGGDDKGKYSCYLSNVTVQCKTIKRSW